MNPSFAERQGGDPEGELDGLLRAYFRRELPRPWPVWRAPQPATVPARPPSRPWRRYAALAASLALLLGGQAFLAGRLTSVPGTPETGGIIGELPDDAQKKFTIKESMRQDGEQPTEYRIEVRDY